MTTSYVEFLECKRKREPFHGMDISIEALHADLFPFQKVIVQWALRRGRAAIFADTGLGKTFMELEWSRFVGRVLILAPLAVAKQTVGEGAKWGIAVKYARRQSEAAQTGITITNYEMAEHFDAEEFDGVVLDESSILKSFDGATRNMLIEKFRDVPYRLCCTATPSPNDHMELGNHSEFLGAMTRAEMLAMYFVHDGGSTSEWRLKGHAEEAFWKFVASWAIAIEFPSDLGFSDEGYRLEPLRIFHHVIEMAEEDSAESLFPTEAVTLTEQRKAKRKSLGSRVQTVAEVIAAQPDEQWIVWCELNDEGDAIEKLVPGMVQVAGSDKAEFKESSAMDFAAGTLQRLVSKSSIFGFGLNFQSCARVVFVGASHSYEQVYQAIRRCWRFGQARPVEVHFVSSEAEAPIIRNYERKEKEAAQMRRAMKQHVCANSDLAAANQRTEPNVEVSTVTGSNFYLYHGDSCEVLASMAGGSIDFSVYSPPFASLYVYSDSDRDLGNCADDEEFFDHYKFIVSEIFRLTKPGRLTSVHCQNFPSMKQRDGFIGIRDFRGQVIKLHQECGWIYHSEVCIWKDPVQAMQRTKALGLLHKQIKKDSCMSRQGIPDYLCTFRKAGENESPVCGPLTEYYGDDDVIADAGPVHDIGSDRSSIEIWQRYASPVWMDINPSDTLQRESAREDRDERHICPLQLDVIRRALQLWSNHCDTVLSPFAGIGSEGYVSLEMNRRFVGVELKRSYFDIAANNLRSAEVAAGQKGLFDEP